MAKWRACLVRNFVYICSGSSRPSGGGNPPLRQAAAPLYVMRGQPSSSATLKRKN
ncbi:MAG: hypothetical protein LBI82_08295 [Dysgonamonadaceae bacterium]|nr:hypothetical protein [Dysgonamonadaceae bacterium]